MDKPLYVKAASIIAWFLILFEVFLLGVIAYWQIMDPSNLVFKTWLKAPLHLGMFGSVGLAIGVFVVLALVQLVALYLFTIFVSSQDKKAYYVAAGLLLLGIWTYLLLPMVFVLGLLLPSVSLQWFGMQSFEDLF
jgi:uncharacterized membrane protein